MPERIPGPEREALAGEIRQRYDNGESIRQIAASLGRSYGLTRDLLVETGATLRPRGGAGRSKR